jgi:probable F420-dependent oxidoreductase
MRFGLTTPIVTLVPRSHSAWETDAGPAELRQIVQAADRLGYHHVSCSEHVGIPTEVAHVRGGRYYDPAATLGFFAGITARVRLLTHVVVLPYHHPLAVAKRYATLDRLSGGRVILGVGVGSLREEFDLLGVDFDGRGPRYDDALKALRAGLSESVPTYAGTHYRFDGFRIDPTPVQMRVPIWLGGRSPRSLRRALGSGDGWDPFHLTIEQLRDMLRRAREWPEWQQRSQPFDIALSPDAPLALDTPEDADRVRALIHTYAEIRATVLNLRFRHRSLHHYLELLERFAQEHVTPPLATDAHR